jgi:hypothetical protein
MYVRQQVRTGLLRRSGDRTWTMEENMTRRRLFSAAAVLALIPAVLAAQPQPGQPAPDFSVADTAWNTHQLSEYRGKVVQLFFWQST